MKMKDRIYKLALEAGFSPFDALSGTVDNFADLLIRECIDEIETYRIPVGNSAAGEMACEWTYDALVSIRDSIKEKFGLTNE